MLKRQMFCTPKVQRVLATLNLWCKKYFFRFLKVMTISKAILLNRPSFESSCVILLSLPKIILHYSADFSLYIHAIADFHWGKEYFSSVTIYSNCF